jgi:hypothetical protein
MDIVMPPAFPETEFRGFGLAAQRFFPALLSDEALFDPQEKRRHFEWSWQAVRYRYRSCVECQNEFNSLVGNANAAWRAGLGDEELTYKLERCVYMFFMNGLSVFDSFTFCLYFLGNAIQPGDFPDVANPRRITRMATIKVFSATFPHAAITALLASLPRDARFGAIDAVRNLLAHRISGRRSVRSSGTLHSDGTSTTDVHEETWHLPGAAGKLVFDKQLLQRHLDGIPELLNPLVSAAREFAENAQTGKVQQ